MSDFVRSAVRRHEGGSSLHAESARAIREQLAMRLAEVQALRAEIAKRDDRIAFLEQLLGLTPGEEVVPLHAVG